MNQQQEKQSKNYEVVSQLDEVIDSLALAVQKSISLMHLGFDKEEAFAEPMEIVNKMYELVKPVKDEMVKTVLFTSIEQAIAEFNTKLKQI